MVFSSAIFLFAFLPAFLALYYATPNQFRSYTITLGSYVFYGWWRVDMLLLLVAVTVWAWGCARMIERAKDDRGRKVWGRIGVSVGLITLAYFKYSNFFMDSINGILGWSGHSLIAYDRVLLPIGISFFTFQAISYVVDVYRRDAQAATLITLAAYKSLFPQLIAGPVLRYKDLDEQFKSRLHTLEKFGEGLIRFAQGFAMKVLIADTVAPLVDAVFAQERLSLVDAWLGALAYTVQLYFDFAGYSSMAIGLGLMIGFRFIENFDQPYCSISITEFWRRWHISLSTWLRDYLYIPLGGNRGSTFKTYRNLILTMVLGGFWHGANWTFVAWGAWHGGLLALERHLGAGRRGLICGLSGLSWLLTMFCVIVGWVMFRAPSVNAALHVYAGMAGVNGIGLSQTLAWQIRGLEIAMLLLAGGIVAWGAFKEKGRMPLIKGYHVSTTALITSGWAALLCISVGKLVADSFSPFLYFQF